MLTLRTAAQQALEALYQAREHVTVHTDGPWQRIESECHSAITALRAALAEPVQEPVAWMDIAADGTRLDVRMWSNNNREEVPLYAHPPERLERNFCPRCGKRTHDIHTCTPPDLSRCPRCGGPADNGHDREDPPNPYLCTRCNP